MTRLPALGGRTNPCACCPPIPSRIPLDAIVAVGFGDAHVERDGVYVYCENTGECGDSLRTVAEFEAMAALDPDHDWRIVLYGPLHGEVYQRHGANEWNLIEKNEGFA